MNDALTVDVNQCLDDLTDVDPCLKLCQSFPALGQVLEGVIPAVLQQDVDVLLVLEGIDELYDMPVPQRLVDLDLDQ